MRELTLWLAIVGVPGSMVLGGGVAYVRCRLRGELRRLDRDEVLEELRRQN